MIATTVTAIKATPKAIAKLEQAKQEKGEDLTKLEMVQVTAPAYIPTVLIGAATITCMFGANALNKRQQASIMSAYALLDSSYKDYRKKVEDLYGEEVDTHIKKEVAKDKYKEADITISKDKELFYDLFSERYFESTIEDVQRAEYRINRNLVMRDYAYLNEFYEEIGLDPIESGDRYGWSTAANMDLYWQSWIDFSHGKMEMDDGLECRIVEMQCEPILDFEDYL